MKIIDLMEKIDFKKFKWNKDQKYEASGFYPFEAPLPLCYNKADNSNYCKGDFFLRNSMRTNVKIASDTEKDSESITI